MGTGVGVGVGVCVCGRGRGVREWGGVINFCVRGTPPREISLRLKKKKSTNRTDCDKIRESLRRIVFDLLLVINKNNAGSAKTRRL